jgi:PAS domain S-box-containing protein
LARLRRGERIDHYETVRRRKDGTLLDISITVSPIRDSRGTIIGASKIARDITDQKRADGAIKRLAAIVETSDDAILSKDLHGVITSWNRGAKRIFGYTADEAIGQPVTILIPPERINEEPEILARIRSGERIDHFETVRQRKDGTRLDVSLSVSPITDSHGRVIGASKIARDITELKKTREALERLVAERTAELSATNKQLEAFVYSIAHDLRAPLRSMQGFSAMLADEEAKRLSEVGKDYAERINKSARFMDALLTDLLAFARITQQRIHLTQTNHEPIVRAVLAELDKDIQDKRANVEVLQPWPDVLAHPPTLTQVLLNLVGNAVKFGAPDRPLLVRLRAEERLEGSPPVKWIRVWVEDNGIGIAPEHQEQIFRLFLRLHRDAYPGTGMGLAIVRKAIERMGGRVGVESELGVGCRFWFELKKA